jgi:hypothetical protein
MKRRDFCTAVSSMFAWSAAGLWRRSPLLAADPFAGLDHDARNGYTTRPPRQFLFTDLRHIDPADIVWMSPAGKPIHVIPSEPRPVRAVANTDACQLPHGIRLVAQPASKEGPIKGDLPSQLIYDDGLYRSWRIKPNYPPGKNLGSYSTATPGSLMIRYGESKDGYAWSHRNVDEVKVSGVTGIDGEHFFVDPRGPAEERYKCLYHAKVLANTDALWQQYQKLHPRYRDIRLGPGNINCLFGLVSPDGLHWKSIPEPLMIHYGDTDNTVYYDQWLEKYVLYTRLYNMDRRLIARAESDDFRHWTPVVPILGPTLEEPFSNDIYTNGRTNYPGCPDQHLMFPMHYRRYTQTSEVHLYTSVDGIRWDRVPGGPVLTPGDPGQWDGEYIAAGKGMVPLGTDWVAVPYMGTDHPHKYPRWPGVISHGVGWARWRKGRLAALVADEEGVFQTFVVPVTGTQLRVNAKVHRAGEIRVGLVATDGRSVGECDPIIGDSVAHPVTWRGDAGLKRDQGNSVRLLFTLRAAELFGFEWV